MRTWLSLVAAVAGAVLMAAGILDYTAAWLFVTGGVLAVVAGLSALGGRGAVPLLLTGVWLLVSSFGGWAVQWNALAGGILLVATAFVATATRVPPGAEPGAAG